MSNSEDLAYCAGLFDGEGCVSAYLGTNGQVAITLAIKMTTFEAIEFFAKTFDLPTSHYDSPSNLAANRKPQFIVRVHGKRVGEILRLLQPWLKTKSKHAELAIQLLGDDSPHVRQGRIPSDQRRLTPEESARRIDIMAALSVLNKKGRTDHGTTGWAPRTT